MDATEPTHDSRSLGHTWSNQSWPSIALYLSAAVLSGAGLLGKIGLVRHLLPLPLPLLACVVGLGICLPLLWPVALRFHRVLTPLALLGLFGVLLVVYPKVHGMHAIGRGTDQPDCITVAADGMVAGQWPYQREKLWSHNPMSCGPGWVALQAPVTEATNYSWNMAAIWAIALAALVWALGWESASGLFTLVALSPGLWLSAANGTDFLTFGISVAALFAVARRLGHSHKVLENALGLGTVLLVLLLSLVAQFRAPTLLIPAFFTRQIGRAAAIWATALALLMQVAFLLWNPSSYIADGPLHILYKLTSSHLLSSQRMVGSLEATLPILVIALLVIVWQSRSRFDWSLLLYLSMIFFVPAVLDLIKKVHLYGAPMRVLEFWEGGMWISACLPLAALMLVVGYRRPVVIAAPVSVDEKELQSA